jgi:hypothetical protein
LGSPTEKLIACYQYIRLEIKKKDALVRLHSGHVKSQGKKRSRNLRLVVELDDDDRPPYSSIYGLPVDTDEELCAMLADEPVVEIVEVSSLI